MNGHAIMLAQATARDLARARNFDYHSSLFQNLIVIGAVLLVVVVVFIWAAFFRKPNKRRHHKHRPHHWVAAGTITPGDAEAVNDHPRDRERRRSRHRRHSGNRTLADTRGLPPMRDDQSAPPKGP